MPKDSRRQADPELTQLGGLFFASSIVLTDKERATSSELTKAKKTQLEAGNSLIERDYVPSKAFLEPIKDDDVRHFIAVIGQDGRIPSKDGSEHLVIPGPMIQEILAAHYHSWFHRLKKP